MKDFSIENGWLTAHKRVVSPHFSPRPEPVEISLLVIHYISLPPDEFGGDFIDRFFQGTLDPTAHPYFNEIKALRVSAHCLINRLGEITQYVNFNEMAWHAGISSFQGREKCNTFSIGIELEGSNNHPFTDAQYQQLAALTQSLMRHYPDITPDRIVGHCDIAPTRKIDPGQYFGWGRYLELVKNIPEYTDGVK